MSSLYKSCLHKKQFKTLPYVKTAIKIQKEKFGIDMNYYLCPFCGYYHLTTKQTEEKNLENIR